MGGQGAIDNSIPVLLVVLPLIGCLGLYGGSRRSEVLRDAITLTCGGMTAVLALFLLGMALQSPVETHLSGILGSGLTFRVDGFAGLMAAITSVIWFLAIVFSLKYMGHEHARTRYYFFLLLTLSGCVGTFVAGDFFTLYLFFELMTVASYVLVVHEETPEAVAAGNLYMYMGIFGGLMLLTGILFLGSEAGTLAMKPLPDLVGPGVRLMIGLMLIVGFGVKAGMVPLHIWLPKAHPVAPSPASALLSAVMIKTGAYGIIRTVNLLMTPNHIQLAGLVESYGFLIIWIGVFTMFLGASIALFQNNVKTILAYSSVSQMGYILMGVGCAAYLGLEGCMGFAGTSYHILNHALFKAAMFMLVGAVYLRTHTLDLREMGGLGRRLPFFAACFLVAVAGITGFPGFGGYVSKTLLHHAVVEAYGHHGDASLYIAENIFMVTSSLTVCYITKLFYGLFFKTGSPRFGLERETQMEKAVFGCFALGILLLGLAPNSVLSNLITPMAQGLPLGYQGLEHLGGLSVWSWHDLQGALIPIGAGFALFCLFRKRQIFDLILPPALSVEFLVYRPLVGLSVSTFVRSGCFVDRVVDGIYLKSASLLHVACDAVGHFDGETVVTASRFLARLTRESRDHLHDAITRNVKAIWDEGNLITSKAHITMSKTDLDPEGDRHYAEISILNADFCSMIIILFLAAVFVAGLISFTRR